MARLSMFPWDVLKIDRAFIDPLGRADNAQHVVRGIVALTHSLGMRTVAEGVETIEQLHRLRDVGCDIVQGYLIDRPLRSGEASQRMTRRTGWDRKVTGISWNSPSAQDDCNAFNNSSWE